MIGWWLVAAQLALLVLSIWPWTPLTGSPTGAVLFIGAALLGIWTLAHNRLGNFAVHPAPIATGRLITSGPYRYVRHPMYAALLLFAAAMCFFYRDIWKLVVWAALALVLWIKSSIEERALRERFADYAHYARGVRRFIPGLL